MFYRDCLVTGDLVQVSSLLSVLLSTVWTGQVLLYLLAASPATPDLPVLAATQRVQQKAAIAIARFDTRINILKNIIF